ncbi:tRNA methyltransferase complex GCD14 subunit-domain-containing protein [Entophlyctis helioformis]|nr:tRNA methyltransferase complex GCD14 subunit-domain-containing protein [Entophlyctis helioformis]
MSFLSRCPTIALGDTAIVYVNPEQITGVVVTKGGTFQNRFGSFHHDDMVGLAWGSRLATRNKRGFVYLLEPTPELWTLALPHRTQILYQPDISLISSFLELQPGVKALEAGTGSGSFSHAIARTVAPTGTLYSFEYHKERSEKAAEEFATHGLGSIIKLEHRDVCKDGFGITGQVTAVFLDLPSPWEALEAAKAAFDPDRIGRICCFSPCIEQVQRTVSVMQKLNYHDIRMYEVLSRSYEVQKADTDKLPLEHATPKVSGPGSKTKKRQWSATDVEASAAEGGRMNLVSKPKAAVRGHTSFLTFAMVLPGQAEASAEASAGADAGSSAEGGGGEATA